MIHFWLIKTAMENSSTDNIAHQFENLKVVEDDKTKLESDIEDSLIKDFYAMNLLDNLSDEKMKINDNTLKEVEELTDIIIDDM